jgi:hypothetical protein
MTEKVRAGPAPPPRAVLASHRFALRMRRPRLRRLAALAYRGVARAASAYLTWGERGASIYLRGGLGAGDFVPGLSDIDVAIVVSDAGAGAGGGAERVRRRWVRLAQMLPPIRLLFDWPRIYSQGELDDLVGNSAFTYGLDDRTELPRRAGYVGDGAKLDRIRMLERPGLYGATAGWRILTGPDIRSPEPVSSAQLRRIAGWLELQYWWRWAFAACVDPDRPRTASLCVKLVAEPARIWLWLAHGERVAGRADALQRALRLLPEEEEALRRALALERSLHGAPDPPLAEVLPAAVRLSARVAALIGAEIEQEGTTQVRLIPFGPTDLIPPPGTPRLAESDGDDAPPPLLPLADWRALACPELPDESFLTLRGDPGDPTVLAAAAALDALGPYPVLRASGLLVLPALSLRRTRLRAVKCPASDPLPFALAEGALTATFPDARGWSAWDTARRAVAEHRAWLRQEASSVADPGRPENAGRWLGMLLTAARAALFWESVREGEPEVCLTVSAASRRLAGRSSAAGAAAEAGLESYREFALGGRRPDPRAVSATRKLVRDLPPYRYE